MTKLPGQFDYKSVWADDDQDLVPDAGAEDEFSKLLDHDQVQQFRGIKTGNKIDAKIVSIGSESIFLDIGQRAEATIETMQFTPEELAKLKVGDKISLYVSRMGHSGIEMSRSLSSRQVDGSALQGAIESGLPVEGKVTGENKGGFTVSIAGTTGFVPFSQMDVGQRQPNEFYIGKTFKFRATRMSGRDVVLSRAALIFEEQAEARAKLLNELKIGDFRAVTVVKLENFGAFVDLGGGVNALLPRSEISWSRQIDPLTTLTIGQHLNVKVLDIKFDDRRPKILVSLKQSEQDPWEAGLDHFSVGASCKGVVTRLENFGAFVEIAPGIEGLVHISEMSAKKRVLQPGEIVKIGQEIEVKITGIDRLKKRVSLSLKALQQEMLDDDTRKKYVKEESTNQADHGVELRTESQFGALREAFEQSSQGKNRGR